MTDEKRAELHERDLATIREYVAAADAPFVGHAFKELQDVRVKDNDKPYFVVMRLLGQELGAQKRFYKIADFNGESRLVREDALEAR